MQSLTSPSYTSPANYTLSILSTPSISSPDDVLIKVHAASINPIDVKKAAGLTRMMESATFPYKIGYDMSGTVEQVGDGVKDIKVGDEVFTMLPEGNRGSVSEYAITSSQNLSLKSSAISHVEAASLPAVAIAALQAFDRANNTITGGLAAKTVLVPAGLSGTGSIAVQLAKHVFRAGKVITTVSTSKVDKVDGFLVKGTVDQIVDYTKTTLLREVEKESVDFMFDTMGLTFACLPLMKPKTGLILSISTPPAGSKIVTHMPRTPFIIQRALDIVDCYYRWRVGRWNVGYDTFFGELKVSDLDRLSVFVIEGKLKPVVGLTAKLSDLQAVKDGCALVKSGKGGVGKFVIMID